MYWVGINVYPTIHERMFYAHIQFRSEKNYYLRPKIIVHFEKTKSFICNFDLKYFYLCYIIFDENYTNEKTFKNTIHSYIFHQILYKKIKILMVKVKRERLKKSKLDNNFGTEGVLNLIFEE